MVNDMPSEVFMRSTLLKKSFFILPFVLIALSAMLLFSYRREDSLFSNYCYRLFQTEMSSDTLTMHYTLQNPASYGIYSYEPVLPVYSARSEATRFARMENALASLRKINAAHLSEANEHFYPLLEHYISLQYSLSQYPYYREPLSPARGMQTQLPLLLAEYRFNGEQDVRDYLALLSQYDAYMEGLICFEQEKAETGLFMAASSVDKILDQCDTLFDKELLESGEHFLQTTFAERTQALVDNQLISHEKKKSFDAENDRLLQTVVAPSYQKLADALLLLKDTEQKLSGLCSAPNGAEYYALYFESVTGSDKSPSEWQDTLYEELTDSYQALMALFQSHPEVRDSLRSWNGAFPIQEPDVMLEDLSVRMAENFPELPDQVHCQVKEVSDSLAPYTAPAYYLTPAIDHTQDNVIYINPANEATGVELYTTLAHEGFPGHLYQTVYTTEYFEQQECIPLRHVIGYGGYVEGWALYVELLSYDYASQALQEAGFETESLCCQALKLNRRLQLALLSLLDILVHSEGADQAQVSTILRNFGINSGEAVYAYLVEEPANYCKYFIGYMEICSLKKDYEKQLGEAATDYGFHRFILECGPGDFAWIRGQMALKNS